MATSPERVHPIAAFLAFVILFPAAGNAAAETAISPYLSLPVFEVIEHFRKQGYPFAYGTNLVPDSLVVVV